MRDALVVQALGNAAMVQEIALKALDLATQEIGRLVDQTNDGVGNDLRGLRPQVAEVPSLANLARCFAVLFPECKPSVYASL